MTNKDSPINITVLNQLVTASNKTIFIQKLGRVNIAVEPGSAGYVKIVFEIGPLYVCCRQNVNKIILKR